MKRFAKTALLLVLATLLLVMGGCAKEEMSIVGVWVLTDMTGSDEAVQAMQENSAAGVKVTMAISRNEIEMVTTYNGGAEYDHQTTPYRLEGDRMITGAAEMVYTLTTDTLTLEQDGVTMVFTRK